MKIKLLSCLLLGAEMDKFSMGLPITARHNEREVRVAYYKGNTTDRTNIEWLKIRIND